MRATRISVMSMLTAVLLAGSTVVAVAQDETPVVDQIVMSGRVERAEDGYAITWPDGWIAQELSDEVHWALYGEPPDDVWTSYLYAQHLDSDADCVLTGLAEPVGQAIASVDAATRSWAAEEDDVRFLETPAGRVGRIRSADEDGWVMEIYVFQRANRWIHLECWSPGPDEDPWRIAQSLEFLPEE